MATFRDCFKYYKSRVPPPDMCDVIDLVKPDPGKVIRVAPNDVELLTEQIGLRATNTWEIWKFYDIPGLIFIKNPFTPTGQCYWITKCLRDYSRKPYKLNIDAHHFLEKEENWWNVCTENSERSKDLIPKLRWATLGYHHNWDTKHYSEDFKDDMPIELSKMTDVIAKVTGFNGFKAEAAIVNYYRMNSTLAGHTDHSEVDREAPLFSISFGQSAIFLIGGLTQDAPANALILRSGDVVAMTGESRLRYHGVPKILAVDGVPWSLEENDKLCETTEFNDWCRAKSFINETRININVRQVLRNGQTRLTDD